jgi:hypothetical protein
VNEHEEEYAEGLDALAEDILDDGSDELLDEDSPLSTPDELAKRVRRFHELRADRDQTKIAADKAKKEFDSYQAEFFQDYQRSPLKGSVTVELEGLGDVQMTPVRTPYARVLDRQAVEKYFRDRNQDKEYVKEDFRMARLHELVRECIEQKKPLPPGLDFYTKEYFRMTMKD